jgi:hypothetical protein
LAFSRFAARTGDEFERRIELLSGDLACSRSTFWQADGSRPTLFILATAEQPK